MEALPVVEKRQPRETALQRFARQSGEFATSLARMAFMAAVLTPLLLAAVLTVDIPMRAFDWPFGAASSVRPSNWLTWGGFVMGLAPFLAVLFARKYGGDEASRAVTASWGLAALAVFAEFSYLAPALEASDLPGVRFTVAFVASAMAAQYMAANIYDIARGGGRWWRAPLFASLGGFLTYAVVYFPAVYWGAGVPWLNWMIGDFAIKALSAFAFLGVYRALRKPLRPSGGYGGR